MEESVLKSTKKILGLGPDYDAFDQDVITHINAAFSTLLQVGVGPSTGFFITGDTETWSELDVPAEQLNLVKTYVYLKVRMLFDPPSTSFHLDAMNKQIQEAEWRLFVFADPPMPVEEVVGEE